MPLETALREYATERTERGDSVYIKIDSNNLIIETYADKHDCLLFVDWSTTNSIMDERGVYRYKLVDGKPVERTQEEMDADYAARPAPEATQLDRIEAQALYTALMTDTLIEEV